MIVPGDGDTVYVVRQTRAGRTVLESYRMHGGGVPAGRQARLVAAGAGRIVLAVTEPDGTAAEALFGLDAATGAEAWRRTGYPPVLVGTGAAGLVLAEPSTGDGHTLAAVDTRTGDVRWTRTVPAGTVRSFVPVGGDGIAVAELDPDGTVRVRDAGTADVVARAGSPSPRRGRRLRHLRRRRRRDRQVHRGRLRPDDRRPALAARVRPGPQSDLVVRTRPVYGDRRRDQRPGPDTGVRQWRLDGYTSIDRYLSVSKCDSRLAVVRCRATLTG
ncbi:hypothetical protein [Dactylosporangium sp. CA-233914]|uniref:hypothetical protein n=1 Tax=Dactylosporangium sp. CA-233914 TaxID=3239934 RepID=UPI003D920677